MADKQQLRQQIMAQIDRCAEIAYGAGHHFAQHGKHAPSSMMAKADADAKLTRLIEEYAAAELVSTPPSGERPSAPAPDDRCPTCGGNDKDMPCAYPDEGMHGCPRDRRLSAAMLAARATHEPQPPMRHIPGVRVELLARAGSAPASAPLPLTDANWTVFSGPGAVVAENQTLEGVREWISPERWARGWTAVYCVIARSESELLARECLAAAPVADERAKAADFAKRLQAFRHAHWMHWSTEENQLIVDCFHAFRALSGGSPEPVSGSEGEEEGGKRG